MKSIREYTALRVSRKVASRYTIEQQDVTHMTPPKPLQVRNNSL